MGIFSDFGKQIDPKKYPGLARTAGIGAKGKSSAAANTYGDTPATRPGGGFGSGMKWDQGAWDKGMGAIGNRAFGNESMARQQSAVAVDQAQQAIASQLAAGGYNPAVFRAGQQAMSEIGQQVAGQTAIAAAQEKAQAQQQYMQFMNQYMQAGLSRDQAAARASLAMQQMQQQAQQNALQRQFLQGQQMRGFQYDAAKTMAGVGYGRRAGASAAKAVTNS